MMSERAWGYAMELKAGRRQRASEARSHDQATEEETELSTPPAREPVRPGRKCADSSRG